MTCADATFDERRGLRTLAVVAFVERLKLAYNNVYFVTEGTALVVIDTGPDYRGAREQIQAALDGRRPEFVVATHGHLDHAGLGTWWQAKGIPVLLGAADLPQTEAHADSDIDLMEEYIRTIGAPENVEREVINGLELRRQWTHRMRHLAEWPDARDGRWPTGLRYEPFTPERLTNEATVRVGSLSILDSPGHTPGNLIAIEDSDPDRVLLFSGDQLLPEITPTPAIQFSGGKRFPSLPRFLDSIRALEALPAPPAICYPGHGEPFENVTAVIDANLAQAEQRTQRVNDEMRLAGEATAYELAERIYPRALRRRFWQIIATVQGHLDVLAESGEAVCESGRWRCL
jgi:glyoxylase-like metal-dependent hydrolase (beta-lactamase superfamily II)